MFLKSVDLVNIVIVIVKISVIVIVIIIFSFITIYFDKYNKITLRRDF